MCADRSIRESSQPSVKLIRLPPTDVFIAFSAIPLFYVRDDMMDACLVLIPDLMDAFMVLINGFVFLIQAIDARCRG